MLKQAAFLSSVFTCLMSSWAWACSCQWAGPFLEVAHKTPLVVVGTVVAHSEEAPIPLSLQFEVSEVLLGTEDRRVLTVYGDNGMLCRPYVERFPVATQWVMALYPDRDKKGAFQISICGSYWLEVRGNAVRGQISRGRDDESEEMSLSALRRQIKKIRKTPR